MELFNIALFLEIYFLALNIHPGEFLYLPRFFILQFDLFYA